jgi:hypothetical protein
MGRPTRPAAMTNWRKLLLNSVRHCKRRAPRRRDLSPHTGPDDWVECVYRRRVSSIYLVYSVQSGAGLGFRGYCKAVKFLSFCYKRRIEITCVGNEPTVIPGVLYSPFPHHP